MKKRRTATSEKRMLGTEEEEKSVWSSGAQLHDVYDHTSTGLHKKSALGSHHIYTHTVTQTVNCIHSIYSSSMSATIQLMIARKT